MYLRLPTELTSIVSFSDQFDAYSNVNEIYLTHLLLMRGSETF